MSIGEFKNSVNLIINFGAKVNKESFPPEIKKILVKIYATTLRINLTDRMVDNITEITVVCS